MFKIFILHTIKELLLGDKEFAKYYYQWRRFKRISIYGMFRGMFKHSGSSPFLFASFGGGDIPLKRKYKNHWNRPIWKHIRAYRLYLDDYKCQYCGSTEILQCHHLNYRSLDTDREIKDCITVCKSCHEKFHGKKIREKNKRGIYK